MTCSHSLILGIKGMLGKRYRSNTTPILKGFFGTRKLSVPRHLSIKPDRKRTALLQSSVIV
jgi:hypothetical protein